MAVYFFAKQSILAPNIAVEVGGSILNPGRQAWLNLGYLFQKIKTRAFFTALGLGFFVLFTATRFGFPQTFGTMKHQLFQTFILEFCRFLFTHLKETQQYKNSYL